MGSLPSQDWQRQKLVYIAYMNLIYSLYVAYMYLVYSFYQSMYGLCITYVCSLYVAYLNLQVARQFYIALYCYKGLM